MSIHRISLPEASEERLQVVMKKTEASSPAEVFSNAFKLYEAMIAEVEAGNVFQKRRPDGVIELFQVFK